jgi:hypothetical protein
LPADFRFADENEAVGAAGLRQGLSICVKAHFGTIAVGLSGIVEELGSGGTGVGISSSLPNAGYTPRTRFLCSTSELAEISGQNALEPSDGELLDWRR